MVFSKITLETDFKIAIHFCIGNSSLVPQSLCEYAKSFISKNTQW